MIHTIYLALKTANVRNAGTNSDAVLILGREDSDLLQHTFESAEGLQAGRSAYYTLDVSGQNLLPEYNYVRLAIRGADAWLPEYAFVWVEKEPQYEGDPVVQPLALKTLASEVLSTDEKEGKLSIPLARSYAGNFYNTIQSVFIVIKTGAGKYAGTKSPVQLTIGTKQGTVLQVPISDMEATTYGGIYLGNFAVSPFRFADLKNIELSIAGEDAWVPEQVIIFGYQQIYGEQKSMSPLVYIKNWKKEGLPPMSTDPKEGKAVVSLYQAYLF
jgi:hypothetical protein